MIAERLRGGADRQHLRMRGRVGVLARAVAGAGDDDAVARDRRADRRLAARLRRARFGEGGAHRIFSHRLLSPARDSRARSC